jgi:hypothetical protein
MRSHSNVRGITLIGFLFLLIVAGFFAYLAMKLVPLYTEYFGVVKSLEQLRDDAGAQNKSLAEIKNDLGLKFSAQYVDDLPPQAIQMHHEGGASIVTIEYERRVHFFYNIDLVASFTKSVNLSGGRAD